MTLASVRVWVDRPGFVYKTREGCSVEWPPGYGVMTQDQAEGLLRAKAGNLVQYPDDPPDNARCVHLLREDQAQKWEEALAEDDTRGLIKQQELVLQTAAAAELTELQRRQREKQRRIAARRAARYAARGQGPVDNTIPTVQEADNVQN